MNIKSLVTSGPMALVVGEPGKTKDWLEHETFTDLANYLKVNKNLWIAHKVEVTVDFGRWTTYKISYAYRNVFWCPMTELREQLNEVYMQGQSALKVLANMDEA